MKKMFVALALAVVIGVLFAPLLTMYARPLADQIIDLSVDGDDEKGWDVYTMEAGVKKPLTPLGDGLYSGVEAPGQSFYRSILLTENMAGAVMELQLATQRAAVFLDDELIYTDQPDVDARIGEVRLSAYATDREEPVLVTLPSDCAGRTLTIAQGKMREKQSADDYAFACPVVLYTGTAYPSAYIARGTRTAYPALLLAAVGAALLALFVYKAARGALDAGVAFLALFALLWMGELQATSESAYYFAHSLNSRLSSPYQGLFSNSAVTMLLLFLLLRMRRYRRFMYPVLALQAACTAIGFLCESQWLFPYDYQWVSLAFCVDVLAILWALLLAALEWRAGNGFYRVLCLLSLGALGAYAAGCLLTLLSGPDYLMDVLIRLQGALRYREMRYPLILLRGVLIASSFVALLYEFVAQEVQKEAALKVLAIKDELARKTYDGLRRQAEQTAIMRHDMNRHLSVIEALLGQGKGEKAQSYAAELLNTARQAKPLVVTGNYMIDLLLGGAIEEAKRAGVEIAIKSAVAPEALPLPDTQLCTLMLNILDNAIRASSGPNAGDAHRMTLDAHVKNGFFCFTCENDAPGKVELNAPPSGGHGYGLSIIRRTVEKYGGIVQIESTPTHFTVSLALPLCPSDSAKAGCASPDSSAC